MMQFDSHSTFTHFSEFQAKFRRSFCKYVWSSLHFFARPKHPVIFSSFQKSYPHYPQSYSHFGLTKFAFLQLLSQNVANIKNHPVTSIQHTTEPFFMTCSKNHVISHFVHIIKSIKCLVSEILITNGKSAGAGAL